jgi:hypothetical protein
MDSNKSTLKGLSYKTLFDIANVRFKQINKTIKNLISIMAYNKYYFINITKSISIKITNQKYYL